MKEPTLFLDANIFVAAVKSPQGGSRLVLNLAQKRKVKVYTVRHALTEAERNIGKKFGEKYLLKYYSLLEKINLTIFPIGRIKRELLIELEKVVPDKDIPIVLGALSSKCIFLITLDRKDLLENQFLKSFPFKTITPGDFIQKYL